MFQGRRRRRTGIHVPDPRGVVEAGGDQPPPVRTELCGYHEIGMSEELKERRTGPRQRTETQSMTRFETWIGLIDSEALGKPHRGTGIISSVQSLHPVVHVMSCQLMRHFLDGAFRSLVRNGRPLATRFSFAAARPRLAGVLARPNRLPNAHSGA